PTLTVTLLTLSLHDDLPIYVRRQLALAERQPPTATLEPPRRAILPRRCLPSRCCCCCSCHPRGWRRRVRRPAWTPRAYRPRWSGDRKSTRLNSSHEKTSYAV